MQLVRYYAGAKAAAGVPEEKVDVRSVAELRSVLKERHGERFAVVLSASSVLVDGVAARDPATELPAEATIEVLPPFAGG